MNLAWMNLNLKFQQNKTGWIVLLTGKTIGASKMSSNSVFEKDIVRPPDWVVCPFLLSYLKKPSGLGPIKYLLVFNEQLWQNKRCLTSCQKYIRISRTLLMYLHTYLTICTKHLETFQGHFLFFFLTNTWQLPWTIILVLQNVWQFHITCIYSSRCFLI